MPVSVLLNAFKAAVLVLQVWECKPFKKSTVWGGSWRDGDQTQGDSGLCDLWDLRQFSELLLSFMIFIW